MATPASARRRGRRSAARQASHGQGRNGPVRRLHHACSSPCSSCCPSPPSCGRRRARARSRSGTPSPAPQAVAALKLTLVASLAVSLLNAVLGTITAWVLVRDDFRGKSLVNAIIDLPFALPTIVAGLTLLALYGPHVADRHQRRLHADGDRARADVRDAAVRRPHGAAGARGARSRGRAGRALARGVAV